MIRIPYPQRALDEIRRRYATRYIGQSNAFFTWQATHINGVVVWSAETLEEMP